MIMFIFLDVSPTIYVYSFKNFHDVFFIYCFNFIAKYFNKYIFILFAIKIGITFLQFYLLIVILYSYLLQLFLIQMIIQDQLLVFLLPVAAFIITYLFLRKEVLNRIYNKKII